jgi:hypothetical protein
MGSGISLNNNQVIEIVKRDLIKNFNDNESNKNIYSDDGYIIYYDFNEEIVLKNTLKLLEQYNSKI